MLREKITARKKHLIVFVAAACTGIILLGIPPACMAGGHGGMGSMGGGGGCCGQDTYYTYDSYYSYPWYNQNGRTGTIVGTYPGYISSPVYSYPTYSSLLPSSYSGLYTFNQPYGYGNTFVTPLWGNTAYTYPFGQVNSKEYTVEQSRTVYVPGGEVTTTVSEGTEVSTIPQYTPYTLYNTYTYRPYTLNPYSPLGSGNWNYTGFGWY
ncbi:MAG: hypothetical protein AB1611_03475 [bacterium]